MNKKTTTRCTVLDLSAKEARQYFLKDTSYCNFDLPPYIVFNRILLGVNNFLKEKRLSDCWKTNPKGCDEVSHIIYSNKDGKYA